MQGRLFRISVAFWGGGSVLLGNWDGKGIEDSGLFSGFCVRLLRGSDFDDVGQGYGLQGSREGMRKVIGCHEQSVTDVRSVGE